MGQGFVVTFGDIILDLPVKILKLTDLRIEHGFNEHGKAYIAGILDDSENRNVINKLNIKTNIKIKTVNDETIFSGVPVNVEVKHINDVFYIYMTLNSYSIQLDFAQKNRSFQNIQNKYVDILRKIVDEYNGDLLDKVMKEALQGASIIQYEETDWEFIKRVASQLGAKIFPDIKSDVPKIYVGINSQNDFEEENMDYRIEKNTGLYLDYSTNAGECAEEDFTSYNVESTDSYELCDRIKYSDMDLIVTAKTVDLENGVLVNRFELKKESGLKQSCIYSNRFEGLSIEGKVIAVEKDKLKLHLSIDKNQKIEEAYWYTFDTSYTTEGSTGWYSMPQVGDCVELYISGRDERKAYIKRVLRTDGEQNPKAQNPAIKYYGTNHGKEMKLAPDELTFSAVENILYVKMTDGAGVEITSDNDINIKTQNVMYGECKTMEIESEDKIVLSTGKANIILDQIVHLKGQ